MKMGNGLSNKIGNFALQKVCKAVFGKMIRKKSKVRRHSKIVRHE